MTFVHARMPLRIKAAAIVADGEEEASVLQRAGDADRLRRAMADGVRGELADEGACRAADGLIHVLFLEGAVAEVPEAFFLQA